MTEVVAALIWDGAERHDRKFLICQRPEGKRRALLWEFVGGEVEENESFEQALIRECKEEIAVTVRPLNIYTDVYHHYSDIDVHLTLYEAVIEEGHIQKIEHNDIRWISTDEIDRYDFCPADEDILKMLKS